MTPTLNVDIVQFCDASYQECIAMGALWYIEPDSISPARQTMSDREPAKASQSADDVRTASLAGPKAAEARAISIPPPADERETATLLKQLSVGTVIDNKYKIDAIIGKGAMGVVLSATHIHLKEQVALKFLSTAANVQSEDFHSRFRREAQVSAKLKNEHITRVIDVGMWRDRYPFMVMDLLIGEDLRVVLRSSPGGRLATGIALDYIVQVCEGLAEAHSHGIVHRDLKPSNLFVTKRHDGSELIKILDFGISKWSEQADELDELTQTGVVLGSPKYMSPEQLFGASEVDSRADVWSLGAIFYEMLSGRPPYDFPTISRLGAAMATGQAPPSLRELVPDLSPALEAAVMRCFAHERDERTPNVAALAGELLDSIGAPFAGQVRQRIGAMLDPKRVGDGMLSSSGALALGAQTYNTLSISTGSNPSLSSSQGLRPSLSGFGIPSSQPGAVGASVAPEPAAKSKAWLLVLAALLLVGSVVAVFLFSGKHSPEDAAVPLPPAPTTPVAATELRPVVNATATATASAPPPVIATATAPAEHKPPTTPHWVPPRWTPPHTAATAKPTAPTGPSTVTTTPPAAPTATAPKSNPLEDRQ
jgi:serine/threonine protein kinase